MLIKHIIITISNDTSQCLIKCSLILHTTMAIQENKVSIIVNDYSTPNLEILLYLLFM